MKIIQLLLLVSISSNLIACRPDTGKSLDMPPVENSNDTSNTKNMKLKITTGSNIFTATFYDNATATAFKSKLPMPIHMTELNENEKYFDLSDNLPTNASNPETIQTGDLMGYGSNTLVFFTKFFQHRTTIQTFIYHLL